MKNKNEISGNIFFACLGLLFFIVGIIIFINNGYGSDDIICLIIFSGIGLIFFLVGFLSICMGIIKNKKNNNLKQTGRKILAEIDSVEMDYSYSINGRHPYIIKACYKDEINCKVYFFSSNRIWFDAEKIIDEFNISTISVYIDNNNFDKYFVDHEEIEKYTKSS